MKQIVSIFTLVAAFGCLAAEPAFEPLFNGKDLTNFKAEPSKEFWRVENGVLIGENNAAKKGDYLWTEKEYKDFVIEFDVAGRAPHRAAWTPGSKCASPTFSCNWASPAA